MICKSVVSVKSVKRANPPLHAGENVVSMLSRGNIRNEWTRKCYGIDKRDLVQHRALSRDIEGGRFPEERPTKIGLYESAIQIRGKFRKGIPRVEKRVPVIHGQTAVVTLSVSMFGSDFDLRFSRMLEQSGVRITVNPNFSDRRGRQIDRVPFYSIDDDGEPLSSLRGRRREFLNQWQNVVGECWELTKQIIIRSVGIDVDLFFCCFDF